MGFRFNKRINLGKGFGINISKSGISPTLRTKYGSITQKQFSVKTGIPGLTYSKRTKKAAGCAYLLCLFTLLFAILVFVTKL